MNVDELDDWDKNRWHVTKVKFDVKETKKDGTKASQKYLIK